jgi:hypothetical protein
MKGTGNMRRQGPHPRQLQCQLSTASPAPPRARPAAALMACTGCSTTDTGTLQDAPDVLADSPALHQRLVCITVSGHGARRMPANEGDCEGASALVAVAELVQGRVQGYVAKP